MTENQEMYQVVEGVVPEPITIDGIPPEPELQPFEFVYPDPPLPEAGGIAWIDLYGTRILTAENGGTIRKVFKISLTCRASTPIKALDGLKEAIDHAEKKYHLAPHSL